MLVSIDEQIAKNDEFILSCENMIKQRLASAPSSAKKEELESKLAKRNQIESDKQVFNDKIKQLDLQKSS